MFLKTIFDKNININLQIKTERYKKYPIRDPRKITLYTRTAFICIPSYVMDCTRAA